MFIYSPVMSSTGHSPIWILLVNYLHYILGKIGLIVGVSCLLCSSALPGVWSFLRVTHTRQAHEGRRRVPAAMRGRRVGSIGLELRLRNCRIYGEAASRRRGRKATDIAKQLDGFTAVGTPLGSAE